MPAQLPSLTALKKHLGIPSGAVGRDERLEQIAQGVEDFIQTYTGRDWQEAPRTAEAHAGQGIDSLVLDHYPASALTAVTVDGNALDVSDAAGVVTLDPQGILYRCDGICWPHTRNRRSILVSYKGGPKAIPADLMLAALEIATWISNSPGGRSSAVSGGLQLTSASEALDRVPTARTALDLHVDHSRGYRT